MNFNQPIHIFLIHFRLNFNKTLIESKRNELFKNEVNIRYVSLKKYCNKYTYTKCFKLSIGYYQCFFIYRAAFKKYIIRYGKYQNGAE